MSDFGGELGRLMAARNLGVRELARRVPCNPGHISNLRSGRRGPSSQTAGRLDEILGAGGSLAALGEQAARMPVPALPLPALAPDADLYDRITRAVDDPPRVDLPVIEWLELSLAEHRRVEDTIGARPLLGLIRAQLSTVAEFSRNAPGSLADRLADLAAQYAQFLAWMCSFQHAKC